jgi:hypothetical protein
VLLKKSHKAFDHGPDAIPGTLPVSRSACFPYNSSSPDGSLELEERVHGKLVFEVRRGSVSIEVPRFRLNVAFFEVLSKSYTSR